MLFRRRAPLTDEEFVERIRHQVQASRRGPIIFTILYGLLAVGMIVMAILNFIHLQGLLDGRGYSLGLLIGSFVGFMFSAMIWNFFNSLFMALSPFLRMHRLLLKYHDLAAPPAGGEVGPKDGVAANSD